MADRTDSSQNDVSSAPESGTDRDDTTGNQPSDRANLETAQDRAARKSSSRQLSPDDPSFAQEEG